MRDFYMCMTINILLIIVCLGAVYFYCYAIYGALDWLRHPHSLDPEFHPAVSILKPICGLDEDADENLASFCQQDYPEYQIIFAVRDSTDPSIEVVQKLMHQFPEREIELIVSDRAIGVHPKVNNLANAATKAKYDLWLVADSDIRVGKDYLQQVVQPFQNADVGVVTCMYRSLVRGWVTRLEAIVTATDFHPGVLVARKLEGISFAFGQTIAIRQTVLEKIGGFEAIADYLADDYQLGYLPAAAGYKVVLSNYVVEHVLASSSVVESFQRQIRWVRGIRVSRPWGYLGKIFTYGAIASLLLPIATKGAVLGWVALVIIWVIRLTMGWIVGVWILKDSSTQRFWWLMPLCDLLSFAIWLCGFVGSSIEWRGQRFKLLRGGKLLPITSDSAKLQT